jgi:hypothetical protein
MSVGDPFREHLPAPHRCVVNVLGTQVLARSNSRELLALLEHAFGALPRHALRSRPARLKLLLTLSPSTLRLPGREPPELRLHSGPDALMGVVDAENFAVITPGTRSAFVAVGTAMLAYPYHLRYELIEFALLTLAARVQELVPLHAACVSLGGRGLLLDGETGAGKSTLSATCIASGFDLVAEDGVFVDPATLRATGCATFLHLRAESLRFVRDAWLRERFRAAPRIRRRSGACKFELDVRSGRLALAPRPPRLAAIIVLSTSAVRAGPLLAPLTHTQTRRFLKRDQPYAAGLPQWPAFLDRIESIPAYRLLRPKHPDDAVRELRALLEKHER